MSEVKLQGLLDQFTVKPEWVDKIVCDWTLKSEHAFTEDELNSLVDTLANRLSGDLRSNFMTLHFGPPKILGEIKRKLSEKVK